LALEDQFVEDGNVCKEYNEDDHFVGKKRDRLASIFQISHNHYEGQGHNMFKSYIRVGTLKVDCIRRLKNPKAHIENIWILS
jgi:hypothetical protein